MPVEMTSRPPDAIQMGVEHQKIAWIYSIIGFCAIFLNIWFSPIDAIPDEPNHFLRALQISEGHLYSKKVAPYETGGDFPADTMRVLHAFDKIKFHPERRVTPQDLILVKQFGWGGPVAFYGINNTAVNPPWSYPGVVAGIWLGKIFDFSVYNSLIMARVLTGVIAVLISAIAISLCQRGCLFLVALASLPMTFHLFGSCSQDAFLIAAAFLAAALLTRLDVKHSPSWPLVITMGLCFVTFIGKPPMLVFVILPILISPFKWFWKSVVSMAIPFFAALGWALTGIRWGKAAYTSSSGMSEHGQMQFILHHPFRFPGIMLRTLYLQGRHLGEQFIGVLGWLDTFLPHTFYVVSMLIALWLLAFYTPDLRRTVYEWRRLVITSFVVLMATILISMSLYIIWTVVGQDNIIGLQGRYFIPVVAFLIVAMRHDAALKLSNAGGYRLRSYGTIGYAMCSALMIAYALDMRYWP